MTQQKHQDITNHFRCETCQKIIQGIILPLTRTSHHFRWYHWPYLSPTEANESAHFRQTPTQSFPLYRVVPTRWAGSSPPGIRYHRYLSPTPTHLLPTKIGTTTDWYSHLLDRKYPHREKVNYPPLGRLITTRGDPPWRPPAGLSLIHI